MMKLPFFFLIITVLFLSCGSKNVESTHPDIFVDPQVKVWMDENHDNSEAVLPVLVSTRDQLDEQYQLRLLKDNYYSGRISVSGLKALMKDQNVLRINSSKKVKHETRY